MGTVFAAPTLDGRFSAGRVLRCEFYGGAQAAMIAASPWLGDKLPSLKLAALRETLHLNHHSWKNDPQVFWVHDLMPENFITVGQLELSPGDLTASSETFAGWQSVPMQALLQWRWDNDREALLRDEATKAAELAELRREQAATRAELMRTLTLDSLADRNWLGSWENTKTSLPLDECRSLIGELITALRTSPKLTLSIAKKHFKHSVQEFNRLNDEYQFISTIEREDLCEMFEQIACAAKFPQLIDQIERWREW